MERREKITPDDPSDGARAMSQVMTKLAIPRFVKSARKPNPAVEPGEPYWRWKHRFERENHYSATKPTRSQLAYGEFWQALFALEDEWHWDPVDLPVCIDRFCDALANLLAVNEEQRDRLPPQLKDPSEQRYPSLHERPRPQGASHDRRGIAHTRRGCVRPGQPHGRRAGYPPLVHTAIRRHVIVPC